MSENGYIKLHRKMLDNPVVCKSAAYFAVWCYLLLEATHTEVDKYFKGERITLQPGQLITSRNSIVKQFNLTPSTVERILKTFENEHQIEQQTSTQNRLITVLNWHLYQNDGQQNGQRADNKRTTSGQRADTNKNDKNVRMKEINNIQSETVSEIVSYLNEKAGTNYKPTSRKTQDLIKARLNEKYTVDDFKRVIDNKCAEWLNTEMQQYLRPETLFGTKFEGYLNSVNIKAIKRISALNYDSRDKYDSIYTNIDEVI